MSKQAHTEKLFAQYQINVSRGDKLYNCGDYYQAVRTNETQLGIICGKDTIKQTLGFNISYNFT